MKTQLSVRVKKESILSKMYGKWYLGPFSMFGKRPVELILDGKTYSMNPSKTPYIYDLQPGTHTIYFQDPRGDSKRSFGRYNAAFQGAVWGFAIGGATGGSASLGALLGGSAASNIAATTLDDGTLRVTIGDGDIIKLSCKANRKGAVKVVPDKG